MGIEQRVASTASRRHEQFEDVNLAIVAESDVVICLLRAAAPGRSGATRALIEHAARVGKPVLQIDDALHGGRLRLSPLQPLATWTNGAAFKPPGRPAELRDLAPLALPPGEPLQPAQCVDAIRRCASQATRRHSGGVGSLLLSSPGGTVSSSGRRGTACMALHAATGR